MTLTRLLISGLLAMLAVGVVVVALQVQRHEGYFSPVFAPNGQDVYFLARETRGLVTGLGWEFFSPPAHVFVWEDRFSLRRLSVDAGEVERLAQLPPSPVEGRRLRTYRGRAFTSPSTLIRRHERGVQFGIRLSIPSQPRAELHFLVGVWNEQTRALDETGIDWSQEWTDVAGHDDSPLFGRAELMALRGREAFPCAIVSQDSETGSVDVLLANGECDAVYPTGIGATDVAPLSRRADIERIQDLTSTHDRLLQEAIRDGMAEHDAALYVIDRMQQLGYYPRPPQLVARLLAASDLETRRVAGDVAPLFVIEEMQFTVGLFQDLERALDSPGIPTAKSMGNYVIHDDYTTSQALNAFLNAGGTTFYVARGEAVYEVEVTGLP